MNAGNGNALSYLKNSQGFRLEDIKYAIINDDVLKAFCRDIKTIYPEEIGFEKWFVILKLIEWIPLDYQDAVNVYNHMVANQFLPDTLLESFFTPDTHQSQVPDHLLEEFAKYKNYQSGWVFIYRKARRLKNAN